MDRAASSTLQRVPLHELSTEEIAERSSADIVDAVCARLDAMAMKKTRSSTRTTPRRPTPRTELDTGSSAAQPHPSRRREPEASAFVVLEDPASTPPRSRPANTRSHAMQTRAMAAMMTHDDKENRRHG